VTGGFINIHFAVEIKTKQIILIEVAKMDVPDGKMLKRVVDVAS
jgi:hypothetical protein